MTETRPRTLAELLASGYAPVSVKSEMRRNLVARLTSEEPVLSGIIGYDEHVIPAIDATRGRSLHARGNHHQHVHARAITRTG